MSRIPEPDATPDGPAYEGRLLERAGDEVVDQGVAFDVWTLFSRRAVLSLIGIGAGSVVLAACSPAAPAPVVSPGGAVTPGGAAGEIPEETAGPFPGDGSNGADVLERSGIVRSDIRTSIGGGGTAAGVPITLRLTVLDMANGDAPFADVAVYVWQCDASGGYSMYSAGLEDETYLRGVQVADATGTVEFTSIFPGCYTGRWPHIHFEVYPNRDAISDSTNVIATSQVALPEDASRAVYSQGGYDGSSRNLDEVSLDTDMVFGDDGGALQLATMTGDATAGYEVSLTVRVDTGTTP